MLTKSAELPQNSLHILLQRQSQVMVNTNEVKKSYFHLHLNKNTQLKSFKKYSLGLQFQHFVELPFKPWLLCPAIHWQYLAANKVLWRFLHELTAKRFWQLIFYYSELNSQCHPVKLKYSWLWAFKQLWSHLRKLRIQLQRLGTEALSASAAGWNLHRHDNKMDHMHGSTC